MFKILSKFNFLLGILLVIISIFPAKILENIARAIMVFLQKIFGMMPQPADRGFLDIIFESFVLEIVATGVYCGTAIFLPIIIFDRFFKNMKINWTPSIIFLFLFFSYFGFEMLKLTFSVISNPNAGFTDIFRMIVMIVGYCIGFITPLFYAYIYNNK
jgi:hypothetical protein